MRDDIPLECTKGDERGTTYYVPSSDFAAEALDPFPRPPLHRQHYYQGQRQETNHSNQTDRVHVNSYPDRVHESRMSADPPARHIKEERYSGMDHPSSFIVTSHGEFIPSSEHKKPPVVLATARICDEHSSVSQQQQQQKQQRSTTTSISLQEEERSEVGSFDSLGGAWRRRGQQARSSSTPTTTLPQGNTIVARAIEASTFSYRQNDPSTAYVSQSRILPSGDDAFSISTRKYETVSPPMPEAASRVAEATVLSERTWSSFDQYRSGIAQADPLYVPVGTPAVVVPTQRLEREKLEDSGTRQDLSSASPRADSSPNVPLQHPPHPPQERRNQQQLQQPPQTTEHAGSIPTALSSASAETLDRTEDTEGSAKLKNMKKNRKRLSAAVAAGGLLVGVALSPFVAVPLAAAGYAATRQAGKHRERKFKERQEKDEEESCTRDGGNQHDNDTGAPCGIDDEDSESEVDQIVKQRFKAEGQLNFSGKS